MKTEVLGTSVEEGVVMSETEQPVSNEGASGEEKSSIGLTKKGRGRPQGSKKLKVCVTDINLMALVSGISNGGSTEQQGRGLPKIIKDTEDQVDEADDSVDHQESSHVDSPIADSPRKRGRPKKPRPDEDVLPHSPDPKESGKGKSESLTTGEENEGSDATPKKRGRPKKPKPDGEALPNGGSDRPKLGRGRPKGSGKRKSESMTTDKENESGTETPRKRGRPKGSPNKTPRLMAELNGEDEALTEESLNSPTGLRFRRRKLELNNSQQATPDTLNGTTKRGRGRPRKHVTPQLAADGSPVPKRGRGRPKGSLNKKSVVRHTDPSWTRPVSPQKGKRGRPRKQPGKRGRPRMHPLPSPDELKTPKVWKPLGRPRKYPRVDPPEGTPATPRRSRGRPPKSASKKGAHLRKSLPATPSDPSDGTPKKRGRPPSSARNEEDVPRKRGRPKGSPNKKKARKLDDDLPDSSLCDESTQGFEMETDTAPLKPEEDAEEETEQQSPDLEVSDQA